LGKAVHGSQYIDFERDTAALGGRPKRIIANFA
jgi:hypothetical protein